MLFNETGRMARAKVSEFEAMEQELTPGAVQGLQMTAKIASLEKPETMSRAASIFDITSTDGSVKEVVDTLLKASLALADRDILASPQNAGGFKGEIREATVRVSVLGHNDVSLQTKISRYGDSVSLEFDRIPYALTRMLPAGAQLIAVQTSSGSIQVGLFNNNDTELQNVKIQFEQTPELTAILKDWNGVALKGVFSQQDQKGSIQFTSVMDSVNGGTTVAQVMDKLGLGNGDNAIEAVRSLFGITAISRGTSMDKIAGMMSGQRGHDRFGTGYPDKGCREFAR
jgi:hypothetical protein